MSEFDISRFNKWTEEEEEFAARNYFKLELSELTSKLGRSNNAIRKKLQMMLKTGKLDKYIRHYTKREDDLILDNYGNISFEELEMLVFRKMSSIRARLLLLIGESGVNCVSGDLLISDLVPLMGYTPQHIRAIAKETDFPLKRNDKVWLCDYEDFWKWIKDNQQYIKAENIKQEDLYHAPEWYVEVVNTKKKESFTGLKKGTYTTKEIALLKHLKLKKVKNEDIAKELNRSIGSIEYMIVKLNKIKKCS